MPSPSSTKSHEQRIEEDRHVREMIGPWDPDGLPSLKAFDADTNFVVKAAAGSGKTTALVARMTALLRTGSATIDELAAITFTRKAAAEMKGRFYEELRSTRSRLEDAIQGKQEPPSDLTIDEAREQKERIDAALQSLSRCFIGTVHAFCGRILRENAFAAGLPPDFEVGIEDDEFDALRKQSWAQYTKDVRKNEPGKIEELAFYGLTPSDVEPLFARLSRDPELEPYTNAPDTPPDLTDAVNQAKAFVKTWAPKRPDNPPKKRKKAQKQIGKAAALIEHDDLSSRAMQAKLLTILRDGADGDQKGKITYKRWVEEGSNKEEAKQQKAEAKILKTEAYPDLCKAIESVLPDWNACAHWAAVNFAVPAAEAFWKRRLTEGQLTHHDVLFATRELLKEHPEVRQRVHDRTKRLLVDEFQDTDPLQAEILFYISNEKEDIDTWREAHPSPGSLFIVGDDKQSIYRFRRADINVFESVVNRVEETGGSVEVLSQNFRSLGNLLTFFNETFPDLFDGTAREDVEDTVQADYEPFTANRKAGNDATSRRVLALSSDVVKSSSTSGNSEEAARIARYIADAVGNEDHALCGGPDDDGAVFQGAATPDDFLILTKNKKYISAYAEALAAAGVPFTVTNSEDLGASPDLRDLVALLRFALRPDDPVAGLAYLQSGLAGFSDDDLYRYKQSSDERQGRPFTLYLGDNADSHTETLGETLGKRFDEALTRGRRTRRTVTTKRPGIAILEIAEREGLVAAAATPADASERGLRAGRLLAVLERIQEQSGEGATWTEITDTLYDIVQGEEDKDSLTLNTGAGNAVRIMNVHQAKGLEAPIVFLAGVSGGNNGSITQHVRRGQDGRNQLVSPVIDEGYHGINTGHAPLGWDYGRDAPFKDLEKAYVEAEEQRLHYVAATRAKNLLVVSCQLKKDKQFADKDGISGYSPWQDLAEQTKDAPLLAVPPASADVDGAGADNLVINGHTHQRVQAIARRSIERTTFTTVSKEKEGERSTLSHGEGYGKDFGTVVHKLMEGMINQRDSSTGRLGPLPERGTIRAMLPDPEFGKIGKEGDKSSSATPPPWQLVPVARRMLTGFRDSKLGQTLASTKTVYTEYPFTSHEKSPGDDSPNTLVRGTIDLVYRDANGWHIVDFKTDRITSAEAAAALDPDHAYRDQIRQYAGAWQALTGEPVASGSLWFTESGTRVYIDEK